MTHPRVEALIDAMTTTQKYKLHCRIPGSTVYKSTIGSSYRADRALCDGKTVMWFDDIAGSKVIPESLFCLYFHQGKELANYELCPDCIEHGDFPLIVLGQL